MTMNWEVQWMVTIHFSRCTLLHGVSQDEICYYCCFIAFLNSDWEWKSRWEIELCLVRVEKGWNHYLIKNIPEHVKVKKKAILEILVDSSEILGLIHDIHTPYYKIMTMQAMKHGYGTHTAIKHVQGLQDTEIHEITCLTQLSKLFSKVMFSATTI